MTGFNRYFRFQKIPNKTHSIFTVPNFCSDFAALVIQPHSRFLNCRDSLASRICCYFYLSLAKNRARIQNPSLFKNPAQNLLYFIRHHLSLVSSAKLSWCSWCKSRYYINVRRLYLSIIWFSASKRFCYWATIYGKSLTCPKYSFGLSLLYGRS